MGTITEKVAKQIISNDGHYEDDTRASKVVTYNNMFDGALTYAVVYPAEYFWRYEESPVCHNVKVLWQASEHS